MAARAMWKGIVRFGEIRVPVKLYAGVEDRGIHFRLLHNKDKQPVRQAMVNPETDTVVEYDETERALQTAGGDLVRLRPEELEALEPEPSRDIEILRFLPRRTIDHRWYDRPYYLGPDGNEDRYAALAAALGDASLEGLAVWTMRKKRYAGALQLYRGYPMLMSLHHAEQVVPVDTLEPPKGKPLDTRELDMARQLIGMLEAEFKPEEYHDEYRQRVLEMIERKAQGRSVKVVPFRRRAASEDLSKDLEASLKREKQSA